MQTRNPRYILAALTALAALIGCAMAGDVLARAAGIPVPGPVLGALILTALLVARGRPTPAALEQVGQLALRHMNLLFIPAAVSVFDHLGLLRREAAALLAALTLSAALSIAVSALVFTWVARRTGAP
jgi:holin-like protein